MINKKFTFAAATALLISQVVIAPIGGAAPQNPQSVKPVDYADNVNLNPTLQGVVNDSNGQMLKKVEFLEGNTYDFSSSDNITGYQQQTKEDPLTLSGKDAASAFNDAHEAAAGLSDNKYVSTAGENVFPAHRFEVDVSESLTAGEKVELYWEGTSNANGVLTLSAWNYETSKWEVLKQDEANADKSDIVLKAEVDPGKFRSGGKIQAMVHDSSPADVNADDTTRLVWFTDTQYYAQDFPEIWESMTDWMIAEYEKGSYEYVFHTGDLVQTATVPGEWLVADENLARMDAAGIPYGVMAGNRDLDLTTTPPDYSYYWEYFGADRYENNEWYGESMDNNRNHYDLITAGGEDFIMLYLGFGFDNTPETIAWANEVLQRYSDRSAILATHLNLTPAGDYGSGSASDVHYEIVRPNENVKLVLSGHFHGATHKIVNLKNADGTDRQVVEVLSNYQGTTNPNVRGSGYLRLMDFDIASDQLTFTTYSPYLDDYNFFADDVDNFTVPFDFESEGGSPATASRSISTDYFGVNLYGADLIGAVENVASGETAEVQWNNLERQTQYFWYMKVTNNSDEAKLSKIFRFTTGDEEIPVAPEVDRVSGDTRYKTAIAISKEGWQTSNTVVLATGAEFPDALAGVPYAHQLEAPILLTRTDRLNAETKAEISRLGAEKVIILGGTAAVSAAVETELKNSGVTVERIDGKTRYETAALIAERIDSDEAVIVQGLNFPDVLAISPYSAKNNIPILMTRTDRVPAETTAALKGKSKTYVIGGTAAVSNEVMSKLPDPTRYGGKTRFDTAKEIVNKLPMGNEEAYVATGLQFPDALTGGVLAAKNNGPILLVRNDRIPEQTNSLLKDYNSFTVFGGTAAVNEKVIDQLRASR
ncbi:cell wall-binding repeat-containing protein [Planococcus sp. X10-3]|uniref:cell wall-binding repeat-containing protein n=1 Tax=Planococcus sp. X10-3 TaxID=3061240 RepID=UPI003BB11023